MTQTTTKIISNAILLLVVIAATVLVFLCRSLAAWTDRYWRNFFHE